MLTVIGDKNDKVNEKGIAYYSNLVGILLILSHSSDFHFAARPVVLITIRCPCHACPPLTAQIDALLEAGIQPCITIFHWDHPQALEDRYGSFSSPEIIDDFVDFARVLFERLGDRCKYWITINEVSRQSRPDSLRWVSHWTCG